MIRSALLALLLIALGWLVPRLVLDDGVGQFRSDPIASTVAEDALAGAWQLQDHPVARLITTRARVTEVRRDPGHCSPGEPGGRRPGADRRAEVRLYTLFAIPLGTVYFRCGGWDWSRVPG